MTGQCPDCRAPIALDPVTPSGAPRYADQGYLYGIRPPALNTNSVVTFWSRDIRSRLEEGTLSAGLAAKRDLERYHTLLAHYLPEIRAGDARHLVELADDDRRLPYIWGHRLASHPVERLALLDAADRCIAAHQREGGNLADLLPRFFCLYPEE